MPETFQAGDVIADRYRLDDLLAESRSGRFWRAHDAVLHRPVAVHIIPCDDDRAEALLDAARLVGPIADRRVLRVLDAERTDNLCFVVNEWGQGESLDILLQRDGPMPPRQVAWLVSEVADAVASAHDTGLAHGRLVPENVMLDHHGQVRIIGFAVDAALLGLPPGRRSADVTDLVSLLYCGLTGKWPGVSKSLMPPAPMEHSHVLRPRRVRAGVPRTLDALCDRVLNPVAATRNQRFEHDVTTARGIHDLLAEFIGDPGSAGNGVPLGPPTAAAADPALDPPFADPAIDPDVDPPLAPLVSVADPAADPEATQESAPAELGPEPELPTQAGMPVFHDDSDEVEWLRARAEAPEPPPPLADIPHKPLFAPEPADGEPVRRPRPGSRAASETSSSYWPWESSEVGRSGSATNGGWPTGTGTGHTGSWGSGSWGTGSWATGEDFAEPDDRVPGRSFFRLALIVGLCALVLVAAVAAYQLRLGREDAETPPPSTSTSAAPDATPQAFTGLSATDFDPQGSPPEENPDQVAAVLDDDPATTWSTQTYKQNFGPGGLKTGVGLVLDLGATKGVREVAVTTEGGDTAVAAYVTGQAPNGISDLTPVGTALGQDVLTITLDEAVSGRFVTIWLTSVPAVPQGFRGTIATVQVRG